MGRFIGKTALVTGAASGIGRATSARLAAEGAAVFACDRDPRVAETAAAIASAGGIAASAVVDVADEAAVARAFARCVEELGGLDIVFANAGTTGPVSGVLDTPPATWTQVFQVNVLGVLHCLQHGARWMGEHGGGSIICTASVAGLRAGAGPAHYSATKAAVLSLVRAAAFELVGAGVRVNAICPGLIETGMTAPIFEMARAAGKEDRIGNLNPLQRAGSADEIAGVVAFLASDDASYVHGEALVVDGGLSASHPFTRRRLF